MISASGPGSGPPPPTPLGPLTVRMGGMTSVMTDVLIDARRTCAWIADEVERLVMTLAGADTFENEPGLTEPARQGHELIDLALGYLRRGQQRAAHITDAIDACIVEYDRTADVERTIWGMVQGGVAWSIGAGIRAMLPTLIPAAIGFVAGAAIAGKSPAAAARQLAGDAGDALESSGILSSPVVAGLAREVTANSGSLVAGFTGVPPALAGLIGPSVVAGGVVMGAHQLGALDETPVTVRRVATSTTADPPLTITDRVNRIPASTPDAPGPQIRIDRYDIPGKPSRFDVYVGGTDDYSTHTGRQPFDLTSDFSALAHQSAGSERAVIAAMEDAGVTRSTPVVLNGYSQGGLVATTLAASGHYDVKGVVTFGAPASGFALPAHVPMLALQHSDDLVPSLGGYERTPQAVVVSRQVFTAPPHATPGHPLPVVIPAHLLSHYRETASLIDGSIDDSLRLASAPFDDFARHASTVTTTTWLATRVESSR